MDRGTGTASVACNALGELIQQTDAMNPRWSAGWMHAIG